jgi:hypothetical protein
MDKRNSMDYEDTVQAARQIRQAEFEDGYRRMADDTEHEKEAEEWAEALIGDALLSDTDRF